MTDATKVIEAVGPKMLETFKELGPKMTRAELIELEIAVRGQMSSLPFETYSEYDQAFINAAEENSREGEIEIDICSTVVSESADNGAYVQAWFWVDNEDAGYANDDEDEEDEEDAALQTGPPTST